MLIFLPDCFGSPPCIPVVAWRMVTMTQAVKKSEAGAESDEALLGAVATRKDQLAYEQLFQRHQQAVFSLAHQITGSKHMAEEAAQEALLKMWTSAALYRGEGTVRSWLFKIVARQSINAIQSMKRARREREENVTEEPTTHEAPSERLTVSELAGALRQNLGQLPELERRLVALHYGCGMSQPEISAELGIPQQTV